jgi:hypothetical protein
MSFIIEMDLAAEDISEDQPSLCFSSDNSDDNLVSDSSSSSLSDNEDEGFKRRALIALIAYKIIKKKGNKKAKLIEIPLPQLSSIRRVGTGRHLDIVGGSWVIFGIWNNKTKFSIYFNFSLPGSVIRIEIG